MPIFRDRTIAYASVLAFILPLMFSSPAAAETYRNDEYGFTVTYKDHVREKCPEAKYTESSNDHGIVFQLGDGPLSHCIGDEPEVRTIEFFAVFNAVDEWDRLEAVVDVATHERTIQVNPRATVVMRAVTQAFIAPTSRVNRLHRVPGEAGTL